MRHAGAAYLVALIAAVAIYPVFLTVLVRYRARQHVASYGPSSHAIKEGTPTMGGVVFVAAGIVAAFLAGLHQPSFLVAFALLSGAAIGLLDDVANIRAHGLGLQAPQKLALQSVTGILVGIGVYIAGFTHQLGTPNLGFWLIPIATFAVIACTNSVNLTDGVDGLAATCCMISFAALAVIGIREGNTIATTVASALCGGLCAFLIFNWQPARVFMGDTGSLALGAALVVLAIQLQVLWLLPLLGAVFVAEVLSVIVNVTAIKRYKRRVFRASPIHHHFEALGFAERRIVLLFGLVSAITATLTVLIAGVPK